MLTTHAHVTTGYGMHLCMRILCIGRCAGRGSGLFLCQFAWLLVRCACSTAGVLPTLVCRCPGADGDTVECAAAVTNVFYNALAAAAPHAAIASLLAVPPLWGGFDCALPAQNLFETVTFSVLHSSCRALACCAMGSHAVLIYICCTSCLIYRMDRCRPTSLCVRLACLCRRGGLVLLQVITCYDMLRIVNWRIFGVYVCITAGSMIRCR